MTQPTLPHAPRARDIPPRWDGHVVAWDGWEASHTNVFVCRPLPRQPCSFCGSFTPPITNRGRVAISGIITPAKLAERDAAWDALPFGSRHLVKPLALYRLTAHRCPDCRHDSVLENLDTWWDLDDTDYSDEGSWP